MTEEVEPHKDIPLALVELVHNLGQWMIIDDMWDIGKWSFEGHDSPFHHWQLGWILKELSLYAGQAITIAQAWNEAGQELTRTTTDCIFEEIESQRKILENILNTMSRLM